MPSNPAESVGSQPAVTSSAIRTLPSILVAMTLLMLFAISSHYQHDAISDESHQQWIIGVGPAHWLSVSWQGTGDHKATNWEPARIELQASWLAPILLVLLVVTGMIRHRLMSRQGLTLGAALDRQLLQLGRDAPSLPALVSQLPRHLLGAMVFAAGTGLVINLIFPVPVKYTIDLAAPATAEQLVVRLEPVLNESFPSFSIRVNNQAQGQEQLIIEGRKFMLAMNDKLSTSIGETGLMGGSRHMVQLSSHPAALPVGLFAGVLLLLLGWRRTRSNERVRNR